jgi:hypothetical protein
MSAIKKTITTSCGRPSHLALYIVLIVALIGCSTTAPPPQYYVEPFEPPFRQRDIPVADFDSIPAEPARHAGIYVEPLRFDDAPAEPARYTRARAVAPRPAPQAQNRYVLLDSASVRKLPNRQGGIFGLQDAMPIPVELSDGTTLVVYRVDRIDHRAPPPFRIGDVLCTVNGAFFSTIDGMPRYVQSLAPGSTATVEYLPRELVTPRRRESSRYASPAQTPSLSAMVHIISIPSKYPRPPGPPREMTEAERRHIMFMHAKGAAYGTVLQAALDMIGGLPSVMGPGYVPPSPFPGNGGVQELIRRNENQPQPKQDGPSIYDNVEPIGDIYKVGPR